MTDRLIFGIAVGKGDGNLDQAAERLAMAISWDEHITQEMLLGQVPVLAKLGWPLRSLAAIVWAKADNPDDGLGAALANDPDQRVRRALAGALSACPLSPRTDLARQQLAADPRFSVRSALHQTASASP